MLCHQVFFYNIIFIPSFIFLFYLDFFFFYIIFVRIYEDSLCYLRQKEATTKCHLCCIFYLDYWTPWAQYSCWWLFIFFIFFPSLLCELLHPFTIFKSPPPQQKKTHSAKICYFQRLWEWVEEFLNIFKETCFGLKSDMKWILF